MKININAYLPRKRISRITGGVYLAFVVSMTLSDMFGHFGIGETEQAFEVLTSGTGHSSVGLVFGLLSAFLFVLAAWGLYVILQSVNREFALLFFVLNGIGVAVQVASYFPVFFAIVLADAGSLAQSFSVAQIQSLQFLCLSLYKISFVSAQLFFGTWLFPLGYLVYKSDFLPGLLGVLLMLDGFAVLLWFFQGILFPDSPAISYPGLALSFVAEVSLGLWLLIKGIDQPRISEHKEQL